MSWRATAFRPPAAFFCHQDDGRLCAGWVGCYDLRGSLGLRIAQSFGIVSKADAQAAVAHESPVPLFASGPKLPSMASATWKTRTRGPAAWQPGSQTRSTSEKGSANDS